MTKSITEQFLDAIVERYAYSIVNRDYRKDVFIYKSKQEKVQEALGDLANMNLEEVIARLDEIFTEDVDFPDVDFDGMIK